MCYFLSNFVFLPKSACFSLRSEFSGSGFCILYTVSDCCFQEVGLLETKPKFVCVRSCVWLFSTPWTVACRASPSMGFSTWEYWRGLPFPPPGDLPDPGIERMCVCVCMYIFSSVQSLSCVQLFATPWNTARQASLSITNSQSLSKLMSIEWVMPSNHLILCHPLLLLSILPSIRVFSSESALCIRWTKYWSFSLSISPSNEHSGLISFRIN